MIERVSGPDGDYIVFSTTDFNEVISVMWKHWRRIIKRHYPEITSWDIHRAKDITARNMTRGSEAEYLESKKGLWAPDDWTFYRLKRAVQCAHLVAYRRSRMIPA